MSLDISLVCECGQPCCKGSLWYANVTHNLGKMAEAAGLYLVMWRPEEVGVALARDAAPLLARGVDALKTDPDYFRSLTPANNWGSYEGLLTVASEYLAAALRWPNAKIEVDR